MLRTVLLALAGSARAARFVKTNAAARAVAHMFIAGEEMDEAFDVAQKLHEEEGISATIDFLGEHVSSAEQARAVARTYLHLVDRIVEEKLDAHVSVKLSQLGLDVDPKLCAALLRALAKYAELRGSFVRVDMEGSAYTERTLDIVRWTREYSPAVGVAIQAYLYRSESDVRALLPHGCRIRLCKGAYKEPSDIAYRRKRDVDISFALLVRQLLRSGIYHGIATHDPAMIEETVVFASAAGIAPDRFEFQMLYGIRPDLQRSLVARGYRMRVYVPFGSEWFPYFMRRLAERPANLWFFLQNMFRR
jgi:proline dehydrogenase